MTLRQTAARLGAGVSTVAVLLAGATLWLVLSDPIAVAGAVSDGDVGALLMAVVKLLGRRLVRLVFER